ncbi:glycosyltransferase family 2 protein [Paenibacillus sp. L3-i20]|uniref:glycosyltransferase family 2 protein n=1 Tax=Paenibacillus sp. L3-i20 TaxID=2905833 RepID=UPI001EDF90D9|nr:glycosyltransferase family 2 protein [Paenibacillus sp. L3-i20]GKU77025.1 glycosyl transferase family 2 [Paenibacillus sp. L3-i20]
MKFTIVIPCFNLAKYIRKTIESVLVQTYTDFELIIIDDGSLDDSYKILQEIENTDKRVRLFSKENGGVSSARNFGIHKSTGDYILFLDGDDLINKDLLKRAHHIFTNTDVDMFSYGYQTLNENTNQTIKKYSSNKYNNKILTEVQFLNLFLTKKISQSMCSFITKKEIIDKNKILFDENTKHGEDQELQVRCISKCMSIFYDSEVLFYYIQRAGSAVNNKVVRENFDVFFRIRNYINEKSIGSYNNYLCFIFFYLVKEIIKRGSETETVHKLINIDYILKNYKIEYTKNNLITGIFILMYNLILKKIIMKKYGII